MSESQPVILIATDVCARKDRFAPFLQEFCNARLVRGGIVVD